MRLVREKTAARYLAMAENTLAELRKRGEGPPCYKTTNRLIAYDLDELESWLKTRRIEPRHEKLAKH
jgi:predicted DNA-binding transcriptional regulator AlpA